MMNPGPESSPPVVPVASPNVTPQALPPRSKAPRESKSIAVPVLKPSLIPFDVLKAHQAEVAATERAKQEASRRPAPPTVGSAVSARESFFERFFASSALQAELDAAGRSRLFNAFAERHLAAGEVLIYEGEVANLMALVTNGSLALEDRTRVGHNANRFEISRGDFVVSAAALLGVPSRFKIWSPAASSVLWLSHVRLAALLKDYPVLAQLPRLLPAATRQLDRDLFWYSGGAALG